MSSTQTHYYWNQGSVPNYTGTNAERYHCSVLFSLVLYVLQILEVWSTFSPLSLSLRWDAVSRKTQAKIHYSLLHVSAYRNDQTSLKLSGFQPHQMVSNSIYSFYCKMSFSTSFLHWNYLHNVYVLLWLVQKQCYAPKFAQA